MLSRVHNTLVDGPVARRPLPFTDVPARVGSRIDQATESFGRRADWIEVRPVTIDDPGAASGLRPLVAEWTARFAALEPDAIDAAVAECLGQVAASLELDRAILWLTNPTDGSASATACWMRGAPEPGGDPLVMRVALTTLEMGAGDGRSQTPLTARPAAGPEAGGPGACRSQLIVLGAFAGQNTREHYVLECGSLAERAWAPPTIELRVIAGVLAQALARKTTPAERHPAREALVLPEPAAEEGRRHSPAVTHSDDVYRRDLPEQPKEPLIGRSRALREVLDQIHQVAATDSTVLLLGETGTGKELLATHLHEMSARRTRSMVRVNCAAIPATLIESELFGREKGAYTGSLARQIGRFELADRSTIFLDEIGDLPADVQVKLLRVLEERRIERLGSPQGIRVDVRIVAATHRNLEERIVDGAFREDLYYRLNVFPVRVPPLRDRPEDIPPLVWLFVDEFSRAFGKRIEAIPRQDMVALQHYSWPGNIRELRNVVERAMIVAAGPRLSVVLPPRADAASQNPKRSLKMIDVEKDHVRSVLQCSGWRIRGAGGAAELLGLAPTTLETRMLRLGLSRPRPTPAA